MIPSSAVFRVDGDPDLEAALARFGAPEGVDLYHRFTPQGESWGRLGPDRRVVLHTWPEHGLVTVDVYAAEPVDLDGLATSLGWRRSTGTGARPDGSSGTP